MEDYSASNNSVWNSSSCGNGINNVRVLKETELGNWCLIQRNALSFVWSTHVFVCPVRQFLFCQLSIVPHFVEFLL